MDNVPARLRLAWVGPRPAELDLSALAGRSELRVATPAEAFGWAEALLVFGAGEPQALHETLALAERLEPARRPAIVVVRRRGEESGLDRSRPPGVDEVVDLGAGPEELWRRVEAAGRARGVLAELQRKNEELALCYAQLEALAKRMADELRLAATVQRSLLPTPTAHQKLDAAWEFMPFREIGGDYFDLIPLPGERVAIAVGDVMGKGVPAALLAGNLKACLRAQLQGGEPLPTEVVERANRLFCDVSPKGLFATLFFGVLDFQARTLTYVNAGHELPFLARANGVVLRLSEGGTVLGLMPESSYRYGCLALGPDELLVLYSDGVTDRTNPQGEAYGLERLCESALRVRRDPARLALYSLLGEVQGFSLGQPPEDDLTLVALKLRA